MLMGVLLCSQCYAGFGFCVDAAVGDGKIGNASGGTPFTASNGNTYLSVCNITNTSGYVGQVLYGHVYLSGLESTDDVTISLYDVSGTTATPVAYGEVVDSGGATYSWINIELTTTTIIDDGDYYLGFETNDAACVGLCDNSFATSAVYKLSRTYSAGSPATFDTGDLASEQSTAIVDVVFNGTAGDPT